MNLLRGGEEGVDVVRFERWYLGGEEQEGREVIEAE